MRPIPLSDNLADKSVQGGARSEEAAIHSEIALRILELRELVGHVRAVGFFEKMIAIWKVEPPAFWVVIRLLTGDLSEISMSYTEQGKADGRSKQATQQELERVVIAVQRHFPLLAAAIIDIRSITAKLGDVSKGA